MHHGEGLALECRMPAANRTTAFGRLFEKQVEQLADIELADIGRGGGPIDTGLLVQVAPPPLAPVDQPVVQNSTRISAGFTFLGQFIDHDMTFMDTVPALGQPHDLTTIRNRRNPFFNLDSVYGDGPGDEASRRFYDASGRFLVGGTAAAGNDLPRDSGGVAIIADPRNDENLIISQIHLVFLRLHNALADALVGAGNPLSADEFAVVRRRVLRRWQFICLQRYLPSIVDTALIDQLLTGGTPRFDTMVRGLGEIAVPVEFAVAAFRFGHSQVREGYLINTGVALPLFNPTGPVNPTARRSDLSGRQPVAAAATVDFALFFTAPSLGTPFPAPFNPSVKIDAQLSSSVFRLPRSAIDAPPVSLAERNLRRGAALELPSGQAVAIALSPLSTLLTPAQLRSISPTPTTSQAPVVAQQRALSENAVRNTPLWFYILKEAEVLESGNKLGPVGEHICGETFMGLLRHDPNSLINLPGHIGQPLAAISPNDPADSSDAVLPASYDVLNLVAEALGSTLRA